MVSHLSAPLDSGGRGGKVNPPSDHSFAAFKRPADKYENSFRVANIKYYWKI